MVAAPAEPGAFAAFVGPVPERSRGHTWCLPSGPWSGLNMAALPLGTRLGPFNGKSGKMRRQGLCAGPAPTHVSGTDRATTPCGSAPKRSESAPRRRGRGRRRRRRGQEEARRLRSHPPTCRPPTCAPNPNQAAPGTPGVAAHNAALPASVKRSSPAQERAPLSCQEHSLTALSGSNSAHQQAGGRQRARRQAARRRRESGSSGSGGQEPRDESLEP